jgi:SAM-dependent methyltransferase
MQLISPESVEPNRVTPDQQRVAYSEARRAYWEEYARSQGTPVTFRKYYRKRLADIYKLSVPPGKKILEIGCGEGNLLNHLQPSQGLGIDISHAAVAKAKLLHPHLEFVVGDANEMVIEGQFDFIVCSDLLNELWDVQCFFEQLARYCHTDTRILINSYSRLWEGPRRIAETLGLAKPQLTQNWLTVDDTRSLLNLGGFEMIRSSSEIMFPLQFPLLTNFFNRYLVKITPFKHLGLTNFMVARPLPREGCRPHEIVTVVVAARNEAGNIGAILDRVPQLGAGTDLVFVEGNSSDNTYEAIEREIAARPGCDARLYKQTGKGKGDAVRLGFEMAKGELLMILDADLTVPPEDLGKFYAAWHSGKGDFINGVRLVYPMEDKAMRFFNLLGNKFFSMVFSWLLSQSIKDTLCGTKVLSRSHYEVIAENRAYFGKIDPFGDFDLIFGAARYNLKIVDLPVRYRERKYGETNIQRWSHGMLLLRMVLLASRCIRFV